MKNLIQTLSVFLVLLLMQTGCADSVTDLDNKNSISENNFWQTEKDANLAIMGVYNALQSSYVFDSDPWETGKQKTEYLSDNGYISTTWGWMPYTVVPSAGFTSTSGGNSGTFQALYSVVNRANLVIRNVPEIESMEQSAIDRIVGEAQTLRSTAYIELAMLWGDIPLLKEPVPISEANIGKTSKEEIFNFLISDLKDAANKLPETIPSNEWGRLSRWATLGMLARAELYSGAFEEAANTAEEIINSGNYSLYPDYTELFSAENEINEEIIFSVTFERGPAGDGSNFAGYWGSTPIPYAGVLPNLADAYYNTDGLPIKESPLYNPNHESENRDPRFRTTILANGDTWQGEIIESLESYKPRKYTEEDNNLNHFDSPQDWYVLRYAHILLIRAEALVQSGNYNESEVINLINQIRERVDMPHVEEVEGTGLSQQALLEVVKHERRVETAFEGLRYFDIRRWGEMGEAYEKYNNYDYGYAPDMQKRKWEERYMKWPLPQSEINTNDSLEQNPDY